jgi:hypothetical protein|tara:strand:- start:244 stop:585 length:342 start_codon:yes stop_codon:yes gene_type:complete
MAYKGLRQFSVVEGQNIAMGQTGSIFVTGVDAVTALNGVFVAIQFIEDTVFDSTNGLIAETTQLFPDDAGTGTTVSAAGGDNIQGESFPAGLTIYGRWTGFELASGKVIAYVG